MNTIEIDKQKYEQLKAQLSKLAEEKSFLQLIINLFNKINPSEGIDSLALGILQGLSGIIGGSYNSLYYMADNTLKFIDIEGTSKIFEIPDYKEVDKVFLTGIPLETVTEGINTRMLKKDFSKSYTWIYPLNTGNKTIGVIKIDNLTISMESMKSILPPIFSYIAMAVQNELLSHNRLKQAFDRLSMETAARKEAETELQKSCRLLEKRVIERTEELAEAYQCILDSTKSGFLKINAEGKIKDTNKRYEVISGYNRKELLSMSITDLEAMEKPEKTAARYDHFQSRHRKKDGTLWDTDISCSYLTSEDGTVFTFITDITDRKKSEEELVKRERLLDASQKLAKIGGWEFDIENTTMYWTDETYTIHGLPIPGEDILSAGKISESIKCYHPEYRPVIEKAFRNCCEKGIEYDLEIPFTSYSGRSFWVRTTARPVYDGDKIIKVTGNIMDITDFKKFEDERIKTEKLQSLGILAGGIAHDFNNILTGILGNISLAKLCLNTSNKTFKPLEEAEKAAARAGELAKQLITFSRGGDPFKKVISIKAVINESLLLVLNKSKVKGVFEDSSYYDIVDADEGQIRQVFNNLILNAKQAMGESGKIYIKTASRIFDNSNPFNLPAGNYLEITVSDTGCGISEENLVKIFDPYFTTKQSGIGLGLPTAYSIIKRHDGHVEVKSKVGKGTDAAVYLPLHGKIFKTNEENKLKPEKIEAANISEKRILVMDDEELIRNLVSKMIERFGYKTETCSDGEKAVSLYRKRVSEGSAYAAVIMDLTIPGGMGGKEASEQILGIDPDACLIVSSGYSIDPVISNFREYGFSGAVCKPFKISELKDVITSLLEK